MKHWMPLSPKHTAIAGFAALTLVTSPSRADTPAPGSRRLSIALFGDSISRGVGADKTLGQDATLEETADLFGMIGNSQNLPVLPEDLLVLNYQLMEANDGAARDHLAALQGDQTYSLAPRLKEATGLPVDPLVVAHMGGSYREGDPQLAAYKNLLTSRGITSPDLVIVDLGRADFVIFSEPEVFQRHVDAFFQRLTSISPAARILVTKIPDVPTAENRPDRIAVHGLLGKDMTCSAILKNTRLSTHIGIIPGADNSAVMPRAIARYQAYNKILAAKVASLVAEGRRAAFVQTYNEVSDPEELDRFLSDDCFHANRAGQATIAANLYPAIRGLLANPAVWIAPPAATVQPREQAEDHLSATGKSLWNSYMASLPVNDMQSECVPRMVWPDQHTAYRGVAFLVPGFAACPQQFNDVITPLTSRGYAVVLPILPGQGRKWHEDGKGGYVDQTQDLPAAQAEAPNGYRTSYNNFVATMNQLAMQFDGEHVLAGISNGGAVAAAITTLDAYNWQRQILISPFYEVHPGNDNLLVQLLNEARALDPKLEDGLPILDYVFNLGATCDEQRTSPPRRHRAGICQFKFGQALGMDRYGEEALLLLQPTTIKTQVIAVQEDSVIDTDAVFRSVAWLRHEKLDSESLTTAKRLDQHQDVRVCYMPSSADVCTANNGVPTEQQGVPCVAHDTLFGYSNRQTNPYWVPLYTEKMVDFLSDGTFFAANDRSRTSGDPLCAEFPGDGI